MWNKVKVVAPDGVEFGIVYSDNGDLALAARLPGQDWPHGLRPIPGSTDIIGRRDCKAYVVTDSQK